MPILAPYVIGVVTAPLVGKVFKPLLRGVVKATVGLALEVKKAAAEAGEELQDIAAEVSVEKAADSEAARAGRTGTVTKTTSSGVPRSTDVTR